MIRTETAIFRLRRDLTLGMLLKIGLAIAAGVCVFAWPSIGSVQFVLLMGLGAIWMVLSYRSAKGMRLAADSPLLIASGRFDEAEQHIDAALRTFSLHRGVKLQSLHHLALLRHAQQRWHDSAMLCQALLGQRLGRFEGLAKPARLILADSLLEIGDLRGSQEAMGGLYERRLSLAEMLNLLSIQLDFESRVGAWTRMMEGVMSKVQLAEIMPAANAARVQAFLALAAMKIGRGDFADWLRRRAELLTNTSLLVKDRPLLAALWPLGERPVAAPAPATPDSAADQLTELKALDGETPDLV